MSDIGKKLDRIDSKLDEVETIVHNIDKEVALHKAAFAEHAVQDEKMYQELQRMNNILDENTTSLQYHIKRTDLLQTMVEKNSARLLPLEIEKIQKQAVNQWIKDKAILCAKICGFLGTIGGAVMYFKDFLLSLLK